MKLFKRLGNLYDRLYRKSREYCCFVIVIPIAALLGTGMCIAGTTMMIQAMVSGVNKLEDQLKKLKETSQLQMIKPDREERYVPKIEKIHDTLNLIEIHKLYSGNNEGKILG